ncbi:MAG: TonB family protein [Reichenbachiella sp.]
MSNYLIELSIIHILLVLGYWCFLSNEQQYGKMRLYLLLTTILAFLIPLISLPNTLFGNSDHLVAIPIDTISLNAIAIQPQPIFTPWNFNLLIWIYAVVSTFFLIKTIVNVCSLIRLARQSRLEKYNHTFIRRVRNIEGSFTFFNWIFLNEDIDNNQPDYEVIIKHETAHVKLGHTYDLLFFELTNVLFWWLPTVLFISKEIKKIHEFQADAYALESFSFEKYSTILINSTINNNGFNLTSSYHDGLILKRIRAMKMSVKNMNPWKIAGLGSMMTIVILFFACNVDPKQKTSEFESQKSSQIVNKEENLFKVVEEKPKYPGGMDALYRYIMNEISYPKIARLNNVEGTVLVEFIVEKDGSLSNVKAVDGIGSGCDAEAIRVLKNALNFEPAKQRGKAVRMQLTIPIEFKLDPIRKNKDKSAQGIIIINEAKSILENFVVNAIYTNGHWRGTIYDEEGKGLPGANIVVAGTTTGTVSDIDGTFKIKSNETDNIVISFVGYQSQLIAKE